MGKLDDFNKMKGGIPKEMDCITYPFYSEDYPKWDDLLKIPHQWANIIRGY